MSRAPFEPQSEDALAAWLVHGQGRGPVETWPPLSLRHLAHVGAIDTVHQTVVVETGVRMRELERWLETSPWWLGPLGPLAEDVTLRAFLQGPLSGLTVGPSGRLTPVALAVEGVLRDGSSYRSRAIPRSAVGPDLQALLLGAGDEAGVVVRATLRLSRRPTHRRALAFSFVSADTAGRWLVELLAAGTRADRGVLDGGRVVVELLGDEASLERDVAIAASRAARMEGRVVMGSHEALLALVPRPVRAPSGQPWSTLIAGAARAPQTWYRASVEGALLDSAVHPVAPAEVELAPDAWEWIREALATTRGAP